MGLRRGDRALDLFTDSGYYGEIMARAVGPRGSVLGWKPTEFTGNRHRPRAGRRAFSAAPISA